MSSSIMALRTHLAANLYPTDRPFAVKNIDGSVDASLITVSGEPFTLREAHTFLQRIKEKGPTLDEHYLHVLWGVFDQWLFQDKPMGYLFFSYKFHFLHPGELSDSERKRLKKRRYVPRVSAGRDGYINPVPTGWMPAGPNAIPPGRWADGHIACDNLIDDYIERHEEAKVLRMEFRLRWTHDGETPSRKL